MCASNFFLNIIYVHFPFILLILDWEYNMDNMTGKMYRKDFVVMRAKKLTGNSKKTER